MNPSNTALKAKRTSVENVGAIVHKTLVSANNLFFHSRLKDSFQITNGIHA